MADGVGGLLPCWLSSKMFPSSLDEGNRTSSLGSSAHVILPAFTVSVRKLEELGSSRVCLLRNVWTKHQASFSPDQAMTEGAVAASPEAFSSYRQPKYIW